MAGAKIVHGFSCNNRCVFCLDRALARLVPDKTTSRIKKEILSARKAGASGLDLLGGEPTVRADLAELADFARRHGFKRILVTTNGRMLCYGDLARKLFRAGITELRFSVHGHNAALHDTLTGRPGSFLQLAAGIKNARAAGFRSISFNTTITSANFRSLPRILAFGRSLGVSGFNLIYAFVPGRRYRALVPKLSQAAPMIRKCLASARPGEELRLINFPAPCGFTDFPNALEDYKRREAEYFRPPQPPGYAGQEGPKRWKGVRAPACAACALRRGCKGVCADYVKAFGYDGIATVPVACCAAPRRQR
jgi:MoaA/NifB/PqqE/SkfB family radical SAM enzyme